MKYWDCINVPGKTNVEGVNSPTPSHEETHALAEGNIETSMTDDTTTAAEEAISITYNNEYVDCETVNELSDEYKKLFNQTFNEEDVKIEPVQGTDDVSISVPTNSPFVDEKTPEEIDAVEYVSADSVDISKYDTGASFEMSDDTIFQTLDDQLSDVPMTEENDEKTPVVDFDKASLLSSIFASSEDLASSIASKVVEKVVETPEPPPVEFALDEDKYGEIIDTLNKYEEEYFKEIPIKHISTRFLRNITKEVYRAHEDAVIKYEDPPIMDPIFLLYPLTTEDPYMAMGKFWSIVTEKISNNRSWTTAISKSVEEYDDYKKMEADFEDDDEDEDDGDCPDIDMEVENNE